eukprot:Tbor_TRINITY_DN4613_c0_g1::TRINITY_DN4613_c0_g1_i1::g.15051::m.15051
MSFAQNIKIQYSDALTCNAMFDLHSLFLVVDEQDGKLDPSLHSPSSYLLTECPASGFPIKRLAYRHCDQYCFSCNKVVLDEEASTQFGCCASCFMCPVCECPILACMGSSFEVFMQCNHCHWKSGDFSDVAALQSFLATARMYGGSMHRWLQKSIKNIHSNLGVIGVRDQLCESASLSADKLKAVGLGEQGTPTGHIGSPISRCTHAGKCNSSLLDCATFSGNSLFSEKAVVTRGTVIEALERRLHATNAEMLGLRQLSSDILYPETKMRKVRDEVRSEANAKEGDAVNTGNVFKNIIEYATNTNKDETDSIATNEGGPTTVRCSFNDTNGTADDTFCYRGDLFVGPKAVPSFSNHPTNILQKLTCSSSSSETNPMACVTLLMDGSLKDTLEVSGTGGTLQKLYTQCDLSGNTYWLKNQPLTKRYSVVDTAVIGRKLERSMMGSPKVETLYTPTPKEVLDSMSISAFLHQNRSPSLLNNCNAGRLLPHICVADRRFVSGTATASKFYNVMYLYLWNFSENDVKVTSLTVAGCVGCSARTTMAVKEKHVKDSSDAEGNADKLDVSLSSRGTDVDKMGVSNSIRLQEAEYVSRYKFDVSGSRMLFGVVIDDLEPESNVKKMVCIQVSVEIPYVADPKRTVNVVYNSYITFQ